LKSQNIASFYTRIGAVPERIIDSTRTLLNIYNVLSGRLIVIALQLLAVIFYHNALRNTYIYPTSLSEEGWNTVAVSRASLGRGLVAAIAHTSLKLLP
jgi:hypothetical protein